MVHAIHSSPRPAVRQHPDAKRVVGLAAAITLNVALLMLLLVPMQGPPPLDPRDKGPTFQWIVPRPETPPPPPVRVPVTRQHAAPRQSIPIAVPVAQDPRPVVDHAEMALPIAADEGTHDTRDVSDGVSEPTPGVTLEYDDAPAPTYPRDALRDGAHGVVMLQVLVDVDGRPLRVDIQRSSGDRRLDVAARRQVLQSWRFRPAMKDGRAVQAIGLVPIAFNLDG